MQTYALCKYIRTYILAGQSIGIQQHQTHKGLLPHTDTQAFIGNVKTHTVSPVPTGPECALVIQPGHRTVDRGGPGGSGPSPPHDSAQHTVKVTVDISRPQINCFTTYVRMYIRTYVCMCIPTVHTV